MSAWVAHPAVFAAGAFAVFVIVVVVALCIAARIADEELERERQVRRAKRDIERGMWP